MEKFQKKNLTRKTFDDETPTAMVGKAMKRFNGYGGKGREMLCWWKSA